MRKRLVIALLVVLICSAGIVVYFSLTAPRVRGAFTVTFLHYTNNADGTNMAVVRLSNQSDCPFRYLGQYNVFFRGVPGGFCGPTRHKPHTLGAGESETLTVSVGYPLHRGVWQAHFLCHPYGWRHRWSSLVERLKAGRLRDGWYSSDPDAPAETSISGSTS